MPNPPRYKLIPLPDRVGITRFHPRALSPNGRYLVGIEWNSDNAAGHHAVVWKDGAVQHVTDELYTLGSLTINDSGTVTGTTVREEGTPRCWWQEVSARIRSESTTKTYIYDKRQPAFIDNQGNVFGTESEAPRGDFPRAYCQNPNGDIVYLNDEPNRWHGFTRANQKKQVLLQRGLPAKENPVTRGPDYPEQPQAILWEPGRNNQWQELLPLAFEKYRRACGVNNLGEIVGGCGTDTGEGIPVIWKNNTPEPLPVPKGMTGEATHINDRGEIAGHVWGRAMGQFLMRDGTFYYIEDLVQTKGEFRGFHQLLEDGTLFINIWLKKGDYRSSRGFLLKPEE